MDTIEKIKELLELMSVESDKLFNKGNHKAGTRARKYAQEIKALLSDFRKNVLDEIKK